MVNQISPGCTSPGAPTLGETVREPVARPYAKRALEVFQRAAENKKPNAATINLTWFRIAYPIARRIRSEATTLMGLPDHYQ
jgi:hypothetical protein